MKEYHQKNVGFLESLKWSGHENRVCFSCLIACIQKSNMGNASSKHYFHDRITEGRLLFRIPSGKYSMLDQRFLQNHA